MDKDAVKKTDENTTNQKLREIERLFSVPLSEASKIIGRFHEEMRSGLGGKHGSLKMIPSYVHRPSGTEKGNFLALDLGGTNLRVLHVDLDGRGGAVVMAASRFVVPRDVMTGTGKMLFDFIACCVYSFLKENHDSAEKCRDLAFTFSFPVEQSAIAEGKLIRWTKGFTACGVEGRDVVVLLTEALKRRGLESVRVIALVNDTVGTLVAASYSDQSCDMGVILGTGTNACYPEKTFRVPACRFPGNKAEMIVNMEWGGFDKLELNVYDRSLDEASPNPGEQHLEKMVSGMYLGEIARLVIVDMIRQGSILNEQALSFFTRPGQLTTEQLSSMADGTDILKSFGLSGVSKTDLATTRGIGRLVVERSARIAATAIASVSAWMDPGIESDHTIAVDGALFEHYPGYQSFMRKMLDEIFGASARKIRFITAHDGSGTGAAIIGAVAASL